MKYISQDEFFKMTNGHKIDIDGVYGAQCVDLFNKFNDELIYPRISCYPSGYAHSIYENRANNGVLNNYVDIGSDCSKLQDGDWVVWANNSKPAPKSHVAMFRLIQGNNSAIFLSQNTTNGTSQYNISLEGVIGILRPKIYVKEEVKVINYKYIGYLDIVDINQIIGWCSNGIDDTILEVHCYIYNSNNEQIRFFSFIADDYREDVGRHGFVYPFDFNTLVNGTYRIECYMIKHDGSNQRLENVKNITIYNEPIIEKPIEVIEEPIIIPPVVVEPTPIEETPIIDNNIPIKEDKSVEKVKIGKFNIFDYIFKVLKEIISKIITKK